MVRASPDRLSMPLCRQAVVAAGSRGSRRQDGTPRSCRHPGQASAQSREPLATPAGVRLKYAGSRPVGPSRHLSARSLVSSFRARRSRDPEPASHGACRAQPLTPSALRSRIFAHASCGMTLAGLRANDRKDALEHAGGLAAPSPTLWERMDPQGLHRRPARQAATTTKGTERRPADNSAETGFNDTRNPRRLKPLQNAELSGECRLCAESQRLN